LDFDNFVIANPGSAGVNTGSCTVADSFQMTSSSGANPPVICGFNTGQHSKFHNWITVKLGYNELLPDV
jgi:hypothetical protein